MGYEALVNTRRNVACSIRLWLVSSSLDASGNQLLIELFTLELGELMPYLSDTEDFRQKTETEL